MKRKFESRMLAIAMAGMLAFSGCFTAPIPVYAENAVSEEKVMEDGASEDVILQDSSLNEDQEKSIAETGTEGETEQETAPEQENSMAEQGVDTEAEAPAVSDDSKDDTGTAQEEETAETEISEDNTEQNESIAMTSTYTAGSAEAWDGVSMEEPEVEGGVYLIGTAAQLKWFQYIVNYGGDRSCKAALTADIDLGNHNWTPIGINTSGFSGSFDGRNHKIYNLSIEDVSDEIIAWGGDTFYLGLFSKIFPRGAIENLTVEGSIKVSEGKVFVGGLVGKMVGYGSSQYYEDYVRISNCVSNVDIESSYVAGGICGDFGVEIIENCTNNGNISAPYAAGGIVGYEKNLSNIKNCKNTGTIRGDYAGGIVGDYDAVYRPKISISQCYNIGDIYASICGGGIISEIPDNTSITHCYNAGIVTNEGTHIPLLDPIGYYDGGGQSDLNQLPVTLEDLWYLDTFEGTGLFGTARTWDELCKQTDIEGFWPAHSGTPVLLREEDLKHWDTFVKEVQPNCKRGGGMVYRCEFCSILYLGVHYPQEDDAHMLDDVKMEEHFGYVIAPCTICGEVITVWTESRMQLMDYDESILEEFYIEKANGYPWKMQDEYLISSNQGEDISTSTMEIVFILKEEGEISFDYSVSSERNNDELIMTLSLVEDPSAPVILEKNTITGETSVNYSVVLAPGKYVLKFSYEKDNGVNTGEDCGRLSNFSLKATEKQFRITEQPKSLESARVGTSVSYHVTAEHAASYQWQYSKDEKSWYNSGASSAKTDTLTLTLSTANGANKYRCKITDTQGTVHYTDTVWVKQVIADGFKITAQPQSVASAKFGDTITYKVTATGAASYQWQYSKDGKTWYNSGVASAKTNTMTLVLSTSNMNNKYRCAIKDNEGTVHYTNTVSVLKVDSFTITKQPSDWDVTKGKAASFSVTAQGASSYQWQYSKDRGKTWYKSSITPTLSSGTSTIKVNIAPSNAANIYRCKVTGKDGTVLCSGSAGFAGAPIVTAQPEDVVYQAGKAAVFTVTVSNPSICSFQWQYSKDGGKNWYNSGATGSKTKSLTLTMKESNLGMLYRCKITGKNNVYLYSDAVQMKK
ncbi:MAG: hypothetical protein Q4B85_13435 [Lachnospiraceae bacterium]|nr:hypothetical protein [Lachnospiraceae bacterium]